MLLCTLDQLLVDLDDQVTEHLLVPRQLKVGQAVLVLPRGVLFGEVLRQEKGDGGYSEGRVPRTGSGSMKGCKLVSC